MTEAQKVWVLRIVGGPNKQDDVLVFKTEEATTSHIVEIIKRNLNLLVLLDMQGEREHLISLLESNKKQEAVRMWGSIESQLPYPHAFIHFDWWQTGILDKETA